MLWISLKDTFGIGQIVMILILVAMSLLITGIILPLGDDMGQATSISSLKGALNIMIIMIIVPAIKSIFKDKTNFDKNRVSLITNKKGVVIFSKVLCDVIGFIIPLVLTIAIGVPSIIYIHNGSFPSSFATNLIVFLVSWVTLYMATVIGVRFIQTSKMNGLTKTIGIVLWITLTFGGGLLSSFILPPVNKAVEINHDMFNLRYVISFVPFINVITPWLIINHTLPLWTVAPMCVYTLIGSIVIWNTFSTNIKEYLCV